MNILKKNRVDINITLNIILKDLRKKNTPKKTKNPQKTRGPNKHILQFLPHPAVRSLTLGVMKLTILVERMSPLNGKKNLPHKNRI